MLDLKKRQSQPDLKRYVWQLEEVIIRTLDHFNITGERREGRIGIWVDTESGEKKIAAIGVRVRHWITLHGLSINVNPDLSHFSGIVPCGISDYSVTSMTEILGQTITMMDLDSALESMFKDVFDNE